MLERIIFFAAFCALALILRPDAVFGQKTEIVLFQINDVYEIAPVEGGRAGGLARVATLLNELKRENPNTVSFLSGDFLNPSVFAYVKHEGEKVKGAQMVDALNAMGLDYATFGNHEFDLKENELQQRINESRFDWISTNVLRQPADTTPQQPEPFAKITDKGREPFPFYKILEFEGADGKPVKMGVFGVCLAYNLKDYVYYAPVVETLRLQYNMLKSQCDFVVAMTHLSIDGDRDLARQVPGLVLQMGGHEHENHIETVGGAVIAKADANARTAYIHRITYDRAAGTATVRSELKAITDSIPDDPATAKVVDKWLNIAYESFRAQGYKPEEELMKTGVALVGTESEVRSRPTNLGKLIARAMYHSGDKADAALYNSGSVRVDDQLTGYVTQYDVLRTLPFGGPVIQVDLKGKLLGQLLADGAANKGTGGYLQTWRLDQNDAGEWTLDGKPLQDERTYRVMVSAYLFSGRENRMDYFTKDNAQVVGTDYPAEGAPREDIRRVVIDYLRKLKSFDENKGK